MAHYTVSSPYVWRATPCKIENRESPLSGATLAVKDLFHISGIATTAGNPSWEKSHPIPNQTASSVQKLLDAGACLVGKTITDELAYSLNGQNKHYGTPKNPITPERLPGGSSSGSAVAVSSGSAQIGLGTDTGGSIRVPASYNGLFGLRPTHGEIAVDNLVALAPSFDTVGWMCKDLNQLEKVADILLPEQVVLDSPPKIGHANKLTELAEHQTQISQLISTLGEHFKIAELPQLDTETLPVQDTFRILQGAEIWQQHGTWLVEKDRKIAADIAERFDWCQTITPQQVAEAKEQKSIICDVLDQCFQQVDLIVLPTTPGVAPLLNSNGQSLAQYRNRLLSLTAFAGLAGLPQLHLPLFKDEHLSGATSGISLLGPKGSDKQLIQWAKALLELHNNN